MSPLAVVIAPDPEGQIALQLLGSDQHLSIGIEANSSLRVEKKSYPTALSQQQPLQDMLQTIWCFLSKLLSSLA